MNLARFVIEGSVGGVSLPDERGFDAENSEEISFRLEDGASNRVRSFHIQVYSPSNLNSPRATKGAPLLALVGKTTGQHVEAANPSANITTEMPADGVHAWIVIATVNGGKNSENIDDADYRFARMIVIRSGAGARKIIAIESTEYQPEGWAEAFNDLIDAWVDGGGGGGTPGLAEVLGESADAGGVSITNLGAPGSGSAAARLGDIPVGLADVLADGASAGGASITNLGAPGAPNSAARLSDIPSTPSLQAVLAVAHSANNVEITSLGAPTATTSAARLGDISNMSENAQTGTTYTFVLSDVGKLVSLSNASTIAATVPKNATTAIPVGSMIYLQQRGAGQMTVTPEDGTVTIESSETLKSAKQHAVLWLWKRATNIWVLSGERELS